MPSLYTISGFLTVTQLPKQISLLFRHITYPSKLRVQLRQQYLYYHDNLLTVSQIITHPDFYIVENGADIALLKLTKPVNISASVCPVSLPPASETFPSGSLCWVTGWGDIGNDGMWLRQPRVRQMRPWSHPILSTGLPSNL